MRTYKLAKSTLPKYAAPALSDFGAQAQPAMSTKSLKVAKTGRAATIRVSVRPIVPSVLL